MQPLDKNISREYDYFMALHPMIRANQARPLVLRVGHGFKEYIDTGTPAGYEYFAEVIAQDYEVADEMIDQLNMKGIVEMNNSGEEPWLYEHFARIEPEMRQYIDEVIE